MPPPYSTDLRYASTRFLLDSTDCPAGSGQAKRDLRPPETLAHAVPKRESIFHNSFAGKGMKRGLPYQAVASISHRGTPLV
jgi:hypothetical protein